MWCHIDSLVQERRSSIANALDLRLSCINPSIWCHQAAMSYFFPQLQVHEKDARNVLDMQNVLRLQEEEVHHLRQDKDDLRVISDTQKQRMHVSYACVMFPTGFWSRPLLKLILARITKFCIFRNFTNVDSSSVRFCDIHLRPLSQ